MQLYRRGRPPSTHGPRKQPGTQKNLRSIQSKSQPRQFGFLVVARIKFAGPAHESLGHGGKHAPVPALIGVGQVGAGDAATKSQMILHGRPGIQAGLQVTQALPIGQLRKTKRQKMIKHRQPTWPSSQGMQAGATRESFRMQTRHDLGKNRAGRRHSPAYPNSSSRSLTLRKPINTLLSLGIVTSSLRLTGQQWV